MASTTTECWKCHERYATGEAHICFAPRDVVLKIPCLECEAKDKRIAELQDELEREKTLFMIEVETHKYDLKRLADLESDLEYQTNSRMLDARQYADNVKKMAKRIKDLEYQISRPIFNEGDLSTEQWEKMKKDIYG